MEKNQRELKVMYMNKQNRSECKGVLAIDLDGTICPELAFPDIAPPWKESAEALAYAKHKGFYLILSSTRTSIDLSKTKKMVKKQYKLMQKYVEKYKLPIDEIDDGTRGKIYADAYLLDNKGWLVDKGRLRSCHIDEIITMIKLGLITTVTYDENGVEQYKPKNINKIKEK